MIPGMKTLDAIRIVQFKEEEEETRLLLHEDP